MKSARQILSAGALCLLTLGSAAAHEIPIEVPVQSFVKPQGERLRVLVRMPLRAVRDVEFPAFGPGYLDIDALRPQLQDLAILWVAEFVEVYENDQRLPFPNIAGTQLSIFADKSFASFDEALAHTTAALLENSANVVWDQVHFDVLLEYPIESEDSKFAVRPGMHGLATRVVTVLRFLPPGGAERAYQFNGDPGVVPLDPSWFQAARQFVEMGFCHILGGVDHLLFLLCLVIPFRKLRPLVMVVTAFTLAHSVTLIASAVDLAPDALWFPPLIETLIAVSILYMALENIVGVESVRRRWMFALGFGLVHGFGFSFALRETLQFAGSHLVTSLLAFNVGVELGQLLVLVLLVPLLHVAFRYVLAERMGTIILSALVAHTAWHWMTERGQILMQYSIDWRDLLPWIAGTTLIMAIWLSLKRRDWRARPGT